jgi:hypothetical protein
LAAKPEENPFQRLQSALLCGKLLLIGSRCRTEPFDQRSGAGELLVEARIGLLEGDEIHLLGQWIMLWYGIIGAHRQLCDWVPATMLVASDEKSSTLISTA